MDVGMVEGETDRPDQVSAVDHGEPSAGACHGCAASRHVPAEPARLAGLPAVIAELRAFAGSRRAGMPIKEMIAEGRR